MQKIVLKKFNETIYYEKLNNGLDVYIWPKKSANNIYATLSVKFGSVDTKFSLNNKEYTLPNGIAHFLEHVKFNESPNKTAHGYYQKLGSSINAFTTFLYTSYEIFTSSNIEKNITHLLDYVETPYFTQKLINKEKGIIVSEVKMGYNNPSQVLYYTLNNSLFHNYNEKYLITGTEKEVENITLEDVNLAYNSFYHPSNMFLTITGNVKPESLIKVIRDNQDKKEFPKWKKPIRYKYKEPVTVVSKETVINGNISIPKVIVSYKIKKDKFNLDDLELLLYSKIIMNANYGATSDIKDYLLTNNLITRLGVSTSIVKDYLIISINTETNYPKEVSKIIKETFNNMSITSSRLTRRIKCNIADYIYGFDDIEFMNMYIQDSIINYGKINDNEYKVFKSLKVNKAKRVIKKLKTSKNATVIMLPKET